MNCADCRDLAIATLREIAQETFCLGPGCLYCDEGEHPPSPAAARARAALDRLERPATPAPREEEKTTCDASAAGPTPSETCAP